MSQITFTYNYILGALKNIAAALKRLVGRW